MFFRQTSAMLKIILTVLVSHFTVQNVSGTRNKVICYYESWASANFPASAIDPNVCTHINYAFLGLKSDGSLKHEGPNSVIKDLQDLKKKNGDLKLMFSVGGWSEGSKTFSSVAASSGRLSKMAASAIQYLKTNKFDGIDIDWEYPGKRGGRSADKKNFVTMLKTLRKKLKKENNNYLLSVAVGSTPDGNSYDVSKISNQVDFINVMSYDFRRASDGKTGQNAPLYASTEDDKWESENRNCEAAIKNWKENGASTSKLILGLPFYGHSYQLKNSKVHNVGAPTNADNGQLPYSEICKLTTGWKEIWDEDQKVPYKYKGLTWISYDNPASVKLKVQFAKKKELGGVMIWAVDQDDMSGSCGFPLLQEIKKHF